MELKVTAPLYGGMSLARDGEVFFVKGAIPGERVEARLLEKKRDYSVMTAVEIVEASPDRQAAPCPVYGECGGCHYQHIRYDRQVEMKQEIICDCLRRLGRMEGVVFEDAICGAPFHYRRRAQFKAGSGRIGFYRENSHDIVEFAECLLLHEKLNQACNSLRKIDMPPEVRELTITAGADVIIYIPAQDIPRHFLQRLVGEGIAAGVVTGDGESVGRDFTEFPLGSMTYTVSARSFMQSNWELNVRLAEQIRLLLSDGNVGTEEDDGTPARKKAARMPGLLDIYGGAGNFSLILSPLFRKITVVEENPFSVQDGMRNRKINDTDNIRFIESTAEDARIRGTFNTVIVDPPRIGLTTRAMTKLQKMAPERIVYVSCNPATLARDAAKLAGMYELRSVRLVDMFPQTFHCEILCDFRLK